MAAITWGNRGEALKAIWDRLKEVAITLFPSIGTITHFAATATADVKTVSGGKKLKVLGWNITSFSDVNVELRFKTSTDVIAGIPGKGVNAMAKAGIDRPLGGVNETVEICMSAAGSVKGWICTEEVD